MNYEFPKLGHLNDVLPYVENDPAFGVMERGPFIVVNYHYQAEDTFSGMHEAVKRECRGLIFDKDSRLLLSRRFHKFFNLNEKPDTQVGAVNWDDAEFITTKLDGSMVSPVAVEGRLSQIRWTTKMGITETSMQAEAFAAENNEYNEFARYALISGYTPIFEWCSRQNRVVIDHPVDQLILIGMRDTVTGVYLTHWELMKLADQYGFPVVQRWLPFTDDTQTSVLKMQSHENMEGVVVQFKNGHMLKVKTEWYVKIHKAKDFITNPRLILQAALSNNIDDVIATLPAEDKVVVNLQVNEFWNWFENRVGNYDRALSHYKSYLDRKAFAMTVAPRLDDADVYFAAWDGNITVREAFIRKIAKKLVSNKVYEEEMVRMLNVS